MALQCEVVNVSDLSPCISVLMRVGDNSAASGGATEISFLGVTGGQYAWGVDGAGLLNSGWVTFQLTIGPGGGPNSSAFQVGNSATLSYGAMTYSSILSVAFSAGVEDSSYLMQFRNLSVAFYAADNSSPDDPNVPSAYWPVAPSGVNLLSAVEISPGADGIARVRVVITGQCWLQSTSSTSPGRNSAIGKIYVMTDTCDPY